MIWKTNKNKNQNLCDWWDQDLDSFRTLDKWVKKTLNPNSQVVEIEGESITKEEEEEGNSVTTLVVVCE